MSNVPLRSFLRSSVGAIALCCLVLLTTKASSAGLITLQNATATFTQASSPGITLSPAATIDGILTSNNGWAIFPQVNTSQTIVWETATNQGSGDDLITFSLIQNQGSNHTLLRYRLSYTTDDRSLFADSLATGGDVTANWTVIDLDTFSGTGFQAIGPPTMTEQADLSILVSGNNPAISTYTASFATTAIGITGFRLEALETTPNGPGPGRQPNQNFALTEFQVDVTPQEANPVPEPASIGLLAIGLLGVATGRRRRGTCAG